MDELMFTPNEVFALLGLGVILGALIVLPHSTDSDDHER